MVNKDFKKDFIIKKAEENGTYFLYVYRKKSRSKVKVNECPYYFRSNGEREKWLNDYLDNYRRGMEDLARIAEYKKTFVNPYKKGDILLYCMVYNDRKNISFWEVIRVTKFRVIIIQLLKDESNLNIFGKGSVLPLLSDKPTLESWNGFTFYVKDNTVVAEIRNMKLWDGKPVEIY